MTAIALPLPGSVRAAIAEARRHMLSRRLRVTALVLLLATAGILIGVNGDAGNSSSGLQLAPLGGSAGMPGTFVASRYDSSLQGSSNEQVFELDLVNARTGVVERRLAQIGASAEVVSSRTEAFFKDPRGFKIDEVSLAGGAPRVIVNGVNPSALAMNPNGTHLAWVTEGPSSNMVLQAGRNGIFNASSAPSFITITDMDLSNAARHSWSFPIRVRSVGEDGFTLGVTAIAWANNDDLAVTTGYSLTSWSCSTAGLCPENALANGLPPPRLMLIATDEPSAAPKNLVIPAPGGFECRLQGGSFAGVTQSWFLEAHGFLASTGIADQLLGYAGDIGTSCAPGNGAVAQYPAKGMELVLLDYSGGHVNVTNVGSLPPGVVPTALDNDGKDLLVTGALTSGPDSGATFIARVTSGSHLVYVDTVPQNDLLGEAWNGATW